MKARILFAAVVTQLLVFMAFCQAQTRDSVQPRVLQRYDKDGDGQLNEAEQAAFEKARSARSRTSQAVRQSPGRDGAPGDTSRSLSRISGVIISEEVSPVHMIEVKSRDGVTNPLAYRLPDGDGPFPAVILFHGGTDQQDEETVSLSSLTGATHTRFLKKGYAIAVATRRRINMNEERTFEVSDGKLSHCGNSLLDCIAAVEAVKEIPRIDPSSVVIYGGSAGAALAIDTASHTELAALAAGEPASHLFLWAGRGKKQLSKEEQRHADATLARVNCPVLILHGDKMKMLLDVNQGPVLTTLKRLGKNAEIMIFPGHAHGFYWGSGKRNKDMTVADLEAVVEYADEFFRKHLATQPSPLE